MVKKEKITYLSEEPEESEGLVKKLKSKLKECQKEKEEYLTQVQRARADLINFQRRQEQTQEELDKYGQENFIRELLPVLDSLGHGAKENEGIKQIKEQLEIILKKYGLKEIETLGEKFNPEFHEAVEQIKSKEEEGTIVGEVQKGYMLGEKVLRPSKVKVAK
ncbi:MAG: nucleotide exchange factor GrpE [Candidatus Portnoybacteria bacterium]|nr:nucleotide exchange factor GrpE [Candidatus Portnoybacteria bacterium]